MMSSYSGILPTSSCRTGGLATESLVPLKVQRIHDPCRLYMVLLRTESLYCTAYLAMKDLRPVTLVVHEVSFITPSWL